MPEGPSIVLLKEEVAAFCGKEVVAVAENSVKKRRSFFCENCQKL